MYGNSFIYNSPKHKNNGNSYTTVQNIKTTLLLRQCNRSAFFKKIAMANEKNTRKLGYVHTSFNKFIVRNAFNYLYTSLL